MFCMTSAFLLTFCSATDTFAQGFGGAGGFGSGNNRRYESTHEWQPGADDNPLNPESALSVIKITGTAEIRVVPDQIRLVVAVTSEAETADQCRNLVRKQVAGIVGDWKQLNIADENIVEDFISVLPRYEWNLIDKEGWGRVRMQQQSGFRMQTNLHVAVPTEAAAMDAIDRAFRHGNAEVVTFDYWSSGLDRKKQDVRAQAVAAAKSKADLLLSVFDERPKAINIQESTSVYFPHSLYKTYENILEDEIVDYGHNEPARIKAYRPKKTFFHGLSSRSDVRPGAPAMRPEIAVVSTVRIYYRSPAEGDAVPSARVASW